jgi:hypothetical protein
VKVKMKASTVNREPVGSVVEVTETEGRTLIAKGFATEVRPRKKKTTSSETDSEGDQNQTQEG